VSTPSLVVVAEAVARLGYEDRLRTTLEAMIEPSLEEPGCIGYRLYVDPNDPVRMVVIEEWADGGALATHADTVHYRHAKKVLGLVLAQPLTICVFTTESQP